MLDFQIYCPLVNISNTYNTFTAFWCIIPALRYSIIRFRFFLKAGEQFKAYTKNPRKVQITNKRAIHGVAYLISNALKYMYTKDTSSKTEKQISLTQSPFFHLLDIISTSTVYTSHKLKETSRIGYVLYWKSGTTENSQNAR